jgi:RND family efflux transporter MFP subunit
MKIKTVLTTLVTLGVIGGLVYYRVTPKEEQVAKGPNEPAVTLQTVVPKDVAINLNLNGSVTSLRTVDVRSQITNTVKEVRVKEGQFVNQGDVLFVLDTRTDKANVEKLTAQLMRDRALAQDQERQYARAQELKLKNFVSQGSVDTNMSQKDAQLALVASDEAALEAAKVALDFNTIRAPISGRTGVINVFPGTLVLPQTVSLLTITQIDPISVQFTVPESQLSKLQAALKISSESKGVSNVEVKVPNTNKVLNGQLYFVDNLVDPGTGTIKAKARFENSKSDLWPGQFVQTKVNLGILKDALSIPSKSIVNSPNGKFVYVVGEDRVAKQKPIKELYVSGENMAVEGLSPNDAVVVEGKQNVRPDAKVRVITPGAGKSGAPEAKGDSPKADDSKGPQAMEKDKPNANANPNANPSPKPDAPNSAK